MSDKLPAPKGDNGLTRMGDIEMSAMKRAVMASAGLDPETLGKHLAAAIDTMVDSLSANKVRYFSKDGVVTDERADVDRAARLKAASELAALVTTMGELKKGESGGGQTNNITLNVPFLEQLQGMKDVTPKE